MPASLKKRIYLWLRNILLSYASFYRPQLKALVPVVSSYSRYLKQQKLTVHAGIDLYSENEGDDAINDNEEKSL